MRRLILLPGLLALCLPPRPADALVPVGVRVGDHPGHSRVVFDWPRPTPYALEEVADAGRIKLRFAEEAAFDLGRVQPLRLVRRVEAEGRVATIHAEPGTRVRHFRLGGRVVVDVGEPERRAAAMAADAAREAAEAPPVVLAQLAAPLGPQRPAAPAPNSLLIQQRPPLTSPAPAPAIVAPTPVPAGAPTTPIRIEAGTGRLITLPSPATTVMAADPRVVRVQPSSPTSIFLMAGAPGRTNVIATNEFGQPVVEYEVTVTPGAGPATAPTAAAPTGRVAASPAAMEGQLRALVPGPGQIRVRAAGRQLFLTGTVPTAADSRRAEAIVRGMAAEDAVVTNELAVLASIQVNLRVRVAEVSREVTRQLGFNWQVLGQSGNFAFGLQTGLVGTAAQAASTVIGGSASATTAAGGRFGIGYSSGGWDVNGLVDALAIDNLVTVLAEPNLTAQSGEVASFLAGGEFPVPVSAGNDGQIGIEFKAFGVSLAFVPIVMSNDRLTLRVRPEVSELSDQGAISVPIGNAGVVRIPALSVRRAETTVELGSGQSFAIAGLLQRSTLQGQEGVNGLVDIPVLGALFRSDRFLRRETELVIIVTPYLVQPVSDPAALVVSQDVFRPATSLDRILTGRQVGGAPRAVPGVPPGVGFRLN